MSQRHRHIDRLVIQLEQEAGIPKGCVNMMTLLLDHEAYEDGQPAKYVFPDRVSADRFMRETFGGAPDE